MSTVFSKILNNEIPCYRIAEDENHLAFLDVFPLEEGHILVIPKQEVDHIFDLSPEAYRALFAFSHHVGIALKKAIPCLKVGMAVVGLEVPHAHIHLIPINHVSDLDFTRPKKQFTQIQFEAIRKKIAAFI